MDGPEPRQSATLRHRGLRCVHSVALSGVVAAVEGCTGVEVRAQRCSSSRRAGVGWQQCYRPFNPAVGKTRSHAVSRLCRPCFAAVWLMVVAFGRVVVVVVAACGRQHLPLGKVDVPIIPRVHAT